MPTQAKEVTGVVVNQQLNVNRKDLRAFRAQLHNLKNSSDHLQQRPENLSNSIPGYVNFINMVNPAKAAKFQQTIDQLFHNNTLQKPAQKPSTATI